MTGSTRLRGPSPRAASACEVIEIRRVISRPPPSVASNVGARMRLVPNEPFFGTDTDDATRLERFVERVDLDSARVIAMTGDLLAELKRRERTVVIQSHILSLVEKRCDRIGILEGGLLRACGTLEELRAQADLPGADLEDLFLALTQREAKDARGLLGD